MADFKQALEWLKDGKAIRRSHWAKDIFCRYSTRLWDNYQYNTGIFFFSIKNPYTRLTFFNLKIKDFEADDWVIYLGEEATFVERIREQLNHIKLHGDKPKVLILNEGDVSLLLNQGFYKGIKEATLQEIFGVKLLKIPDYLKDLNFLKEGTALIIGENNFKTLKEVFNNVNN